MLFADRLREVKRAAHLDGQPRESWLTEFGWDNLAGPKVSPYQQAAYLARGWMLALAAGTDKCFWFYDYDAPEPKQFFDGCGLFAADSSPKLASCALGRHDLAAAQSQVRRQHHGRTGHLGLRVPTAASELVAALWSIDDDDGPTVSFRPGTARLLGNRLPGLSAKLRLAPVYAVGLDPARHLVSTDGVRIGDARAAARHGRRPVTPVLEIRNGRQTPLDCTLRLERARRVEGRADRVHAVAVPPGESSKSACRSKCR